MKLTKHRLFFNYQREEQWINEMAADGWHLTDFKYIKYSFEKDEPRKYDYRMELLADPPTSDKGKEYLEFMEDAGIECVTTYSNWAYFRKEATDEPFEIYTDYESRKKHLTRVITTLAIVLLMNFLFAVYNTFVNTISSLNIVKYVSILNWLVVVFLTPVILIYLKNIRDLKQNRQ